MILKTSCCLSPAVAFGLPGTFSFTGLGAPGGPRKGAPWTEGLSVDEAIEKLVRECPLSDVKVSFNSFDPEINVRRVASAAQPFRQAPRLACAAQSRLLRRLVVAAVVRGAGRCR